MLIVNLLKNKHFISRESKSINIFIKLKLDYIVRKLKLITSSKIETYLVLSIN